MQVCALPRALKDNPDKRITRIYSVRVRKRAQFNRMPFSYDSTLPARLSSCQILV